MSRVLIVHADPTTGARLAAAMMEVGLEVAVVTSGERAMDRFIQEPSDVLVIDYDLDGRDGVTAAEAIRWMPGGRRARIVLTSLEEPEDGDLESMGSTLDAYATRVGPVDPRRIAEIAKRASAVRPHEAETRILSEEQALLEAEKMRRAVSSGWVASHDEPSRAIAAPLARDMAPELEDFTQEDGARAQWELPDPDGTQEGEEVLRVARASAEASSRIMGTFVDVRFSRVLSRLADGRATGALVCIHPPDERATTSGTEPTKIVYFRAGVPAHVRSNVVRECLGQVLSQQRKIGPATLRESLDAVRRGEGRQGEVLVRMGALSAVELSEALAEQLRIKLFDLFFWKRGTFRFTHDRPPPSELIDLEMGLAEIVFRGVRLALPPQEALDQLAPRRDRYVLPEAKGLVRFVRLEAFGAGLREMIRRADGTRTVGELLETAASAGEAAQLLHAMECLDAVRFELAPLRPMREISRVAPATTADASEEIPTSADASGRSPIAMPAPLDELATHDEPVELPTPREPLAVSEPLEPDVPDEVEGWEETTANEEVELPEDFAPPEPVTPHEALTADEASGLDSIEASLDEAPAEPTGSGLRPRLAEELDEAVKAQLKAERFFRRGLRALDRDDGAKALSSFEEAAALCPDESRFALYVVYGEHVVAPEDEALRQRALEHVERACDREPELPTAHLLRARLYAAAGRSDDAVQAYSRVLELDPAHRAAKTELKDLRQR